ncbi:hypothetical protein XBI1_650031 [Xenorhabdus bovienii str. Intermedium]|uniref:Uncharacterized protein n=1 Tax=Xenorhabdus bovienii str. Intermedium TaxID=1379677 RepID=A0A077QMW1_XENBV|nr:hypothetical protein XBI1_650031 [Xenorhabdus bovienii str. Intermedium]
MGSASSIRQECGLTKLKLSAIVNIKQSHLLTPDDVAYFGLVNPKCRVNNKNR